MQVEEEEELSLKITMEQSSCLCSERFHKESPFVSIISRQENELALSTQIKERNSVEISNNDIISLSFNKETENGFFYVERQSRDIVFG